MRSRRERRDTSIKALDLMGQLTMDLMNIIDEDFNEQEDSNRKARADVVQKQLKSKLDVEDTSKEENPNYTWWMQREESGKRRERKSQVSLICSLGRFVSVRMD